MNKGCATVAAAVAAKDYDLEINSYEGNLDGHGDGYGLGDDGMDEGLDGDGDIDETKYCYCDCVSFGGGGMRWPRLCMRMSAFNVFTSVTDILIT